MQQQNETSHETNEWVEVEERAVPADAYNNCCHLFIGQADAESRD